MPRAVGCVGMGGKAIGMPFGPLDSDLERSRPRVHSVCIRRVKRLGTRLGNHGRLWPRQEILWVERESECGDATLWEDWALGQWARPTERYRCVLLPRLTGVSCLCRECCHKVPQAISEQTVSVTFTGTLRSASISDVPSSAIGASGREPVIVIGPSHLGLARACS